MANEVVGTVTCWGKNCDETASVHETKRGGKNRKGSLYLNCPSCKCLQPTSESSQRYIKQNMVARPGYEYLTEQKEGEFEKTILDDEKEPETTEKEPALSVNESAPKSVGNQVNKGPLAFLGVVALGMIALAS